MGRPAAWARIQSQSFPSDGGSSLAPHKSGRRRHFDETRRDFQLALDWKLSKAGNAGIFYRGTEEYDKVYWSAPEYQLLDDSGHPDGGSRLTSSGADYGLYAAPAGVVKPADQWNSTLIVVNGNTVQHWLNGQKLLEYEVGSPDWEAKVKASKFVAYPNYGRAKRGHIAIQGDHEGALSLRNIRIREIK